MDRLKRSNLVSISDYLNDEEYTSVGTETRASYAAHVYGAVEDSDKSGRDTSFTAGGNLVDRRLLRTLPWKVESTNWNQSRISV